MSIETASKHTRPGPKTGTINVRSNLLNAAADVLLEKGLDNLSLRDVAQTAGVNQAMIRYYFGDKTGMLKALLDFGFEKIHSTNTKDDRPEDNITSLISALNEMPWLPILMMQAVYTGGALRETFLEKHAPSILQRLSNNIPKGSNASLAALALLSGVVFPHLARPLVGPAFNVKFDDNFAADYARLLTNAIQTEVENDRI